ncbi:Protein of unknown function [Cotesia congregata]|uniref:Uncharacterized protein n=1 Tax=Cotesia congregata TaxID=51543 RepID=A0A8J2MH91_COTCN|nr:Protein of unknown function [Cotesia congregata]
MDSFGEYGKRRGNFIFDLQSSFMTLQCWKINKLIVSLISRIIAALNDRAAIRENNSVIPSLVFEETDQYSALRHSAIVMARFSTIS